MRFFSRVILYFSLFTHMSAAFSRGRASGISTRQKPSIARTRPVPRRQHTRYATPINGEHLRSAIIGAARVSHARGSTPNRVHAPLHRARRRKKNDASRTPSPSSHRLCSRLLCPPGTSNMASMTSSAVMPASRVAGFAPRRNANARVVRRGAVAQAARGESPRKISDATDATRFLPAALGAREGQIPATARVTGAADGLMRPRYHPLTHLPRL